MSAVDELIEANRRFADSTGALAGKPPMPPTRHVAIVTCMDARIVPAQIFGLREGEAHVIRNAGGSARDRIEIRGFDYDVQTRRLTEVK